MSKYKRVNLGYKDSPMTEVKAKKQTINYPSFYVQKKLPLNKTSVGKTFNVKAKIKCVGLDQRTGVDKDDLDYRFEIRELEF